MGRIICLITTMCVLILSSPTYAGSSEDRHEAFKMLYKAYQEYATGNRAEGRKSVEAALKMYPDLAYGNIVMGEISMKDQDWTSAQKYYEKGLVLLK